MFQTNVALWQQIEPQAAILLPYTDHSSYTTYVTEKGQLNLKKKENGKEVSYHSEKSPLQESIEWFSSLNLKDIEVLYVYGIGLGYAYEASKQWLKENLKHQIVFLEDDLAVIYKFFEAEIAEDLLRNSQAHLFYIDNLESESSSTSELFWQFMTSKISIYALPVYEKTRNEFFQELQHKLVYDITLRDAITEEYFNYGVSFFRNFYPNILLLPGSSLGNAMENAFYGVPAIICGAGPSLSKHLSLLSSLSENALIFAGGSSINVLNSAGFQPHLGAGIDPNSEQYKRIESNQAYEVPFIYRNRMYHKAFQKIHGPHIYITGSGGYDISEWFEKYFQIEGCEIDEGFNVVNFCVDVARSWGCNPIIFVGMDLAYTDLQAYAEGVVKDAKIDLNAFLNNPVLDQRPILRPDIYGKPTYTLWKWISESQWISDFAKNHTDLTLINATEGGIGFPNVPNVPLQEVCEKYFTKTFDIYSRLHGEIQNHLMPQVNKESVESALELLKDSLRNSMDHLTTLMQDIKNRAEKIQKEQKIPDIAQSGLAALAETELADEIAYKYVLEVFNIVYTKKLNYELKAFNADKQDWKYALRKAQLNLERLGFLRDVANANLTLIEYAQSSAVTE